MQCEGCREEITESCNSVPITGSSYPANVWLVIRDAFGDIVSPERRGKSFCQKCTATKIIVMLQNFLDDANAMLGKIAPDPQ